MRRRSLIAALGAMALALSGCGERQQEMKPPTKAGAYQGKPDTQPWNNAAFNQNKTQWEDALKARNQNQNEYTRVP